MMLCGDHKKSRIFFPLFPGQSLFLNLFKVHSSKYVFEYLLKYRKKDTVMCYPTHGDKHCRREVDWEQVGAEHASQLDLNTVNAVILCKWIFNVSNIITSDTCIWSMTHLMCPRRFCPQGPAPWKRHSTAGRADPLGRDWTCRSASPDSSRTRLKKYFFLEFP